MIPLMPDDADALPPPVQQSLSLSILPAMNLETTTLPMDILDAPPESDLPQFQSQFPPEDGSMIRE